MLTQLRGPMWSLAEKEDLDLEFAINFWILQNSNFGTHNVSLYNLPLDEMILDNWCLSQNKTKVLVQNCNMMGQHKISSKFATWWDFMMGTSNVVVWCDSLVEYANIIMLILKFYIRYIYHLITSKSRILKFSSSCVNNITFK